MAVTSKSKEKHQISPDAAVAGVLALLVDAREARTKDDKDAQEDRRFSSRTPGSQSTISSR